MSHEVNNLLSLMGPVASVHAITSNAREFPLKTPPQWSCVSSLVHWEPLLYGTQPPAHAVGSRPQRKTSHTPTIPSPSCISRVRSYRDPTPCLISNGWPEDD